jgi:hypothetical protein
MSLLRLLTSGRCLVGLQRPVARYRMKAQGMLPQFATNANPFRQTASPTNPGQVSPATGSTLAACDQASVPCQPDPPSQKPHPLGHPSPPVADALNTPTGSDACELKAPASPAAAPATPGTAGRRAPRRPPGQLLVDLWQALCGAVTRGVRKAPKPGLARSSRLMRQGELSLDTVCVVRNDLSDSDLEIVRPKAQFRSGANVGPESGRPAATDGAQRRALEADPEAVSSVCGAAGQNP